MAYDPDFGEWVREHLAALGPLEIKRMFGAAAVYANGLIFALLDDGVVWLKADEVNAPLLVEAGARQFTYPTKGGAMMAMASRSTTASRTSPSSPATTSRNSP